MGFAVKIAKNWRRSSRTRDEVNNGIAELISCLELNNRTWMVR